MPEPLLSRRALNLRPSVFAQLAPRLQELGDRCLPLHIGDTYRLPPQVCREALCRAAAEPSTRYFEYTHPFGRPALLEALSSKLWLDNGVELPPDGFQVTCGATQGLAAIAQACLEPGDEVLVLSPHWPLIRGIISTVGGQVVEVDYAEAVEDPEGVLGALSGPQTKAIYLANPNNPDGRLLTEEQARALHRFAQSRGLFLWSDEAYEHIVFEGQRPVSLLSLERQDEPPCVISVFTFSKSFGMAGLRLGYLAAHPRLMVTLRRVCNHQIYNLSDLLQEAAWAALTQPRQEYLAFLEEQRQAYRQARDLLLEAFPGQPAPPAGAYVFLPWDSPEQAWERLQSWLDRGVCVAPGEAFGANYGRYLRLCFTAVPLDRLAQAVEVLRGS